MTKKSERKAWRKMTFHLYVLKRPLTKISQTIIATTLTATCSTGAYNALAHPVKADTEIQQTGVALS